MWVAQRIRLQLNVFNGNIVEILSRFVLRANFFLSIHLEFFVSLIVLRASPVNFFQQAEHDAASGENLAVI